MKRKVPRVSQVASVRESFFVYKEFVLHNRILSWSQSVTSDITYGPWWMRTRHHSITISTKCYSIIRTLQLTFHPYLLFKSLLPWLMGHLLIKSTFTKISTKNRKRRKILQELNKINHAHIQKLQKNYVKKYHFCERLSFGIIRA